VVTEDSVRGKKVVVASDVPLYAESIRWMLTRQEEMEVSTARCFEGALPDLAQQEADAFLVECGGLLDWSGLAALCRNAAPHHQRHCAAHLSALHKLLQHGADARQLRGVHAGARRIGGGRCRRENERQEESEDPAGDGEDHNRAL